MVTDHGQQKAEHLNSEGQNEMFIKDINVNTTAYFNGAHQNDIKHDTITLPI